MLLTVKKIQKENEEALSLVFDKPENFQFYSAQFIDAKVEIPNPDNSRIFSFSSSPTEGFLMITFKKGISDYKQKLQNIKVGETISITHPSGTYTLDETAPAIMLAAGVGIAPHRSMIKQAVDQKLKTRILLIYSNADENFAFKKELEGWEKQLPNLEIVYIETRKEGRLDMEKLNKILKPKAFKSPIYYLAGPPSFVYGFYETLQLEGVDKADVRLDSFDGY